MKRSKRYSEARKVYDKGTLFSLVDGVDLLKKIATNETTKAKFDETVEVAFNLNLKPRHTIRDTITLPHSTDEKETKILVFAKGDKAEEAKQAGATYVGDSDLIEKIQGGWYDFDVAIATPDMMKDIGKLGKYLGRRGLMPNPKTGTVTTNLSGTIEEFMKGKTEYRADKTGIVHMKIGKVSMENKQIVDNAKSMYRELLRKKPQDLKGEYIRSIAFSTTMGPGIKIAPNAF